MPEIPVSAAEILTATAGLCQDAIAACRDVAAAVEAGGDPVSVTVAAGSVREAVLALEAAKLIPQQVAALLEEGARIERERAKAELEERPGLYLAVG